VASPCTVARSRSNAGIDMSVRGMLGDPFAFSLCGSGWLDTGGPSPMSWRNALTGMGVTLHEGIVAPVRRGELSSAPLQCRRASAWCYLNAAHHVDLAGPAISAPSICPIADHATPVRLGRKTSRGPELRLGTTAPKPREVAVVQY